MADDVAVVEPAGRDECSAPPSTATVAQPTRARRIVARLLLVLGCALSAMCLLGLYACWHDDHDIDAHLGRADADVLSVVFNRTAVRFVTPDGTVNIPPNGVLYPGGLAAGERVRVEYDTLDPKLVRVAGRDYALAFLPVGSTIAGTWLIIGPLVWWLRRPRRATS